MFSRGAILVSDLWESFKMAMGAMWAHKMRAGLTLIGVVIGVMTIISTMTVLGGIKYKVDESIQNGLSSTESEGRKSRPNTPMRSASDVLQCEP
jgi:hypothetical protein